MKLSQKSGAVLAATAAAMLIGGAVYAPAPAAAMDAKVHCMGINACKGQGACKTAMNACNGQNACKGKGWVEKTAEECKAAGGTEMKS